METRASPAVSPCDADSVSAASSSVGLSGMNNAHTMSDKMERIEKYVQMTIQNQADFVPPSSNVSTGHCSSSLHMCNWPSECIPHLNYSPLPYVQQSFTIYI